MKKTLNLHKGVRTTEAFSNARIKLAKSTIITDRLQLCCGYDAHKGEGGSLSILRSYETLIRDASAGSNTIY